MSQPAAGPDPSATAPSFDVVAVNIQTGEERVIASRETERDAEAIVSMAVARRGVEKEFFKSIPHR